MTAHKKNHSSEHEKGGADAISGLNADQIADGSIDDATYQDMGKQSIVFAAVPADTAVATGDGIYAVLIGPQEDGKEVKKAVIACGEQALLTEYDATGLQVNFRRVRKEDSLGDSTTQIDITNPSGDTMRYTYDGTGTDPGIENADTSLQVGDYIYIADTNLSSGNEGYFELTAVGNNYFDVTNASGVVESNKTIGSSGEMTPRTQRDILSSVIMLTEGDMYATSTSIETNNDDLQEGDIIYLDVEAIADVHKGLSGLLVIE